jgi:hypothetical protein
MKSITFFPRALALGILFIPVFGYADGILSADVPALQQSAITVLPYISPNNYLQNPYMNQPMLGQTHILTESQIDGSAGEGFWERLFTDGTYNVAGAGSVANLSGAYYQALGGFAFAQTGRIGGFALGGLLAIQTPQNQSGNYLGYIYSTNIVELSQAYVEYQYSNIVQADVGRIAINTPWLNSSDPSTTAYITYQGMWVNVQPLDSLLLSALAINEIGNPAGFHPYTLYNSTFGFPISTAATDPGAIGFGAEWNPSLSYNLNFWAYQF